MLELLIADLYLWCAGATLLAIIIKIVIIALFVFSIIGIISTIRFFVRLGKKKDPLDRWLKTGKMK